VDTNPRALRFASFNAALNGLSNRVTWVQGDLLSGTAGVYNTKSKHEGSTAGPLVDVLRDLAPKGFDRMTANPPFLPVPEEILESRHGLFSSGGASGEAVLAAILALARQVLKDDGYAAIVSEFFFSSDNDVTASAAILNRLQSYYSGREHPIDSRGLLLTNAFSISADEYAERRADAPQEAFAWKRHLDREQIVSCSPGLLYVQKKSLANNWRHVLVPKSEWGSIWTPSNPKAVQFTQEACHAFFKNG
jgi:hypothetical protein